MTAQEHSKTTINRIKKKGFNLELLREIRSETSNVNPTTNCIFMNIQAALPKTRNSGNKIIQ